MTDLFKLDTPINNPSKIDDADREFNIYKAVKSTEHYGISHNGLLVTGLFLEVYAKGCGYDLLTEEIGNLGTDAIIHLPKGGLIEGNLYYAVGTELQRDWESGLIDYWEVQITPFKL